MSQPNYALEGRIREACADAGVLATALDDFVIDFRTYKFTSEAELPKWIEQMRTEKPHRFSPSHSLRSTFALIVSQMRKFRGARQRETPNRDGIHGIRIGVHSMKAES